MPYTPPAANGPSLIADCFAVEAIAAMVRGDFSAMQRSLADGFALPASGAGNLRGPLQTVTNAEGRYLADVAYVFCSGISTRGMGERVALGYSSSSVMRRDSRGANIKFMQDAEWIWNHFGLGSAARPQLLRFYGHSAGGAVCECLARIAKGNGKRVDNITTYGAPKPGFAGVCVEGPGVRRARYMYVGDPVPMVPAGRMGDVMSFVLSLPGLEAAPYECVHGSGGIVLDLRSDRPGQEAFILGGAAEQIEEWINGDPQRLAAHNVGSYVLALRRMLSRRGGSYSQQVPLPTVVSSNALRSPATPVAPRFVPQSPPTPSPTPTVQYPVLQVTESRTTYTNGFSFPSVPFTGDPMSQAKIIPRMRMRVKKVGDHFGVFWQSFQIVSADKITKAKTFAKAGNRWLRIMGNDVTINGPNIVVGLSTFVALAGVAGNGVNPPLVVV